MTDHADTIRREASLAQAAALDALLAERQQAQQERDTEHRLALEYLVEIKELRDQRRQAIDALERIAYLPPATPRETLSRIAQDTLTQLGRSHE